VVQHCLLVNVLPNAPILTATRTISKYDAYKGH
jgi:hypothetical protein